MPQSQTSDLSPSDQERLDGFLDCLARQLAIRWLKDQRTLDDKPSATREQQHSHDDRHDGSRSRS